MRRASLEDVYLDLLDEEADDMRLLAHQLFWDQRIFWRNRESAVFVFLFPILLYLLLSTVYDGDVPRHGRPPTT